VYVSVLCYLTISVHIGEIPRDHMAAESSTSPRKTSTGRRERYIEKRYRLQREREEERRERERERAGSREREREREVRDRHKSSRLIVESEGENRESGLRERVGLCTFTALSDPRCHLRGLRCECLLFWLACLWWCEITLCCCCVLSCLLSLRRRRRRRRRGG
jgi:hypothetical protein